MATNPTFLSEPPSSELVEASYQEDLDDDGYVNNLTRLWCWRPDVAIQFVGARAALLKTSTLNPTERAVIIAASVSQLGDSYCSLAWGRRLAEATSDNIAADVLSGGAPAELSQRERALAQWARAVVTNPNGTTEAEIDGLRTAGLTDLEIFEATALVAFRVAFSMVNDSLGALPDRQLAEAAPDAVRMAVTYGRRAATVVS